MVKDKRKEYLFSKWIDATKRFHVTVKDIKKLKPGESIKYLHLDYSVVWNGIETETLNPGSKYTAMEFFEKAYWEEIIRRDDIDKPQFKMYENNTFQEVMWSEISFDTPHKFYVENDHGILQMQQQSLNKYPDHKRIGGRGFFINIEKFDKLPLIYYTLDEWDKYCDDVCDDDLE